MVLNFDAPQARQSVTSLSIAAEHREIGHAVADLALADQRLDDRAGRHRADHGAVLRRDLFMWSIMRMPPAPGISCATTFGLPGNVFAEVPRHHARADVDAAAGGAGDQEGDLLALVEVLRVRGCADRSAIAASSRCAEHHHRAILPTACACARPRSRRWSASCCASAGGILARAGAIEIMLEHDGVEIAGRRRLLGDQAVVLVDVAGVERIARAGDPDLLDGRRLPARLGRRRRACRAPPASRASGSTPRGSSRRARPPRPSSLPRCAAPARCMPLRPSSTAGPKVEPENTMPSAPLASQWRNRLATRARARACSSPLAPTSA